MFILVSLINHFPSRISGASGKGGEGGDRVPAVPPLWPLTAPSNERRHSHTDASLLADLSSSLSSSLPFATALSSCRQSTQAVHWGTSSSPPSLRLLPCFLSPSRFIYLTIPHLYSPTPPSLLLSSPHSLTALSCLVLSILCRKQLLNRHFYWPV